MCANWISGILLEKMHQSRFFLQKGLIVPASDRLEALGQHSLFFFSPKHSPTKQRGHREKQQEAHCEKHPLLRAGPLLNSS